MAEAQTGAGTATVTRALAEDINQGAAPGDRVSEGQLRGRVQREEGVICMKHADKPKPETQKENAKKKTQTEHEGSIPANPHLPDLVKIQTIP